MKVCFKKRNETCLNKYKHLVNTKHKKLSIIDIRVIEKDNCSNTKLICICDCGKEVIIAPAKLTYNNSCFSCKHQTKSNPLYKQLDDFWINTKANCRKKNIEFFEPWRKSKETFFYFILDLESKLSFTEKQHKFSICRKNKNIGFIPENLYLKCVNLPRKIVKEIKKEIRLPKPKTLKEEIIYFINEQPKDLDKTRLYKRLTMKFNKSIKEIFEIIEK